MILYSLIYLPFIQQMLNAYSKLGIILGPEDTVVNKTKSVWAVEYFCML